MGIGAVVYSRQLYVEAAGLMILGLAFVYVVLTDPNHWVPKVREDKETTEKKDQITGPAEGDENGKNDNN